MGETSTVIGIPGATNCYSLHAAAALCRRYAAASLVTVMKFHDGLGEKSMNSYDVKPCKWQPRKWWLP